MTDQTLDASIKNPPVTGQPKESDTAHEGLVGEFLHSFGYAALQQPITGLTQIADGLLGTHIAQNVQFISAPDKANGTGDWLSQQAGGAAGMLLPFLLVGKGVKSVIGEGSEAGLLSERAAMGFSLKEAATTGFLYDAFLQPSSYKDGSRSSFLVSRFLNGTAGAATFSALTLTGLGLGKFADSGLGKLAESSAIGRSALLPLLPVLRSPIAIGLASGVPGGAISAEIGAVRTGRLTPTWSEVGQSVTTMSLIGGMLGAGSMLRAPHDATQSNFEYLTGKIKDHVNMMKESTNSGLDTVGNALFPNGAGLGMRPAFAMAADGAGYERPLSTRLAAGMNTLRPAEPTYMIRNADEGGGSATPSDLIRAKFEQIKRSQIVTNRDGQDYVFHELKSQLQILKKQALVGPEWDIVPSQVGSPADRIGADYLLINSRTGDVHMMDGTSNMEKYENPQGHNVPVLREGGLVYFDSRWFDQLGKLRTDSEEPTEIQTGVQGFRQGVREQLFALTSQSSPFKLGTMPLPDIVAIEPAVAKAQIDQYLEWVRQNVKEPGVNDYIRTVQKSSTHLDIKMKTSSSPEFTHGVERATDKAVTTWAVNKLLGKEPNSDAPRGSVYYHAKSGRVSLTTTDGGTVDGGDMSSILLASRGRALNDENLARLVSKKQMEQIRANPTYADMTDKQILQQIQNVIINGSNEIRAGGRVGMGSPTIINQVVRSLNAQPENVLLGIKPEPAAATPAPNAAKSAGAIDAQPQDQLPPQFQSAVDTFAQAWYKEGFLRPSAGQPPNVDEVSLIVSTMLDDPAVQPMRPILEAIDQAYKAGNPQAVLAITKALNVPH